MKFTINREEILNLLQRCAGVAEKKTTMPILANVLMQADADTLTLTATDLEVCLICSGGAKISKPGGFTLPAKSLLDITKEFPRGEVEFELIDNNQVELRSQKSQFRLVGMGVEDFPKFPQNEKNQMIHIPANQLRQMVERTAFSISNDEMRYSLNGILFEIAETGSTKAMLRLVSTDGHRLSLTEYPLKNIGEVPFKEKVVLPKKGVLELKRMLDDSNEEIALGFDGANGIAKFKGSTLYMRRIIGEFPDYRKVIPEETKRNVSINRQDFIAALKRMTLMASVKHKLVRFDFHPENLEMTCQNPEMGTAHEEVSARYDGSPMTIGFNPRYFLDALTVMDEKEIGIGFLDELSPAVINAKDDQFKCVIMPMRL